MNREKIGQSCLRVALLLLIITPFITGGGLYYHNSTLKLTAWSVAILLALIGWGLQTKEQRAAILRGFLHPVSGALLLFISWLTVRTIFSWDDASWWGSWIRTDGLWMWWSWWLLWPLVRWFFQNERTWFNWCLRIFVLVALLTTVVQPLLMETSWAQYFPSGRWTGFVGNAIYLALVLLFVPWAVFVSTPEKRLRWWPWFVSLVLVWMFYEIGTRSIMLGFVVGAAAGVAVWLWHWSATWWKKILVCLGGAALVGGLLWGGQNYLGGRLFDFNLQSSSVRSRLALWQVGLEEWKKHPVVGFGFGNHYNLFDQHLVTLLNANSAESFFDTSHSAYVDLALAGGGVAVLLWFLFAGVGWCYLRTPLERATLLALLAAVATAFLNPWANIPLLFLLATGRTAGRLLEERKNIFWEKIGVYVVGGTVGATALITIITVPWQAFYLQRLSDILTRDVQMTKFVAASEHLFSWMPFAAESNMQLTRAATRLLVDSNSYLALDKFNTVVLPPIQKMFPRRDLTTREYWGLALFAGRYALIPNVDKAGWQDQAEKLLHTAVERSPHFPAPVYDLATLLYMRERGGDAVVLLRQFAQDNPTMPETFFYLARFEQASGQLSAAKVDVRHALDAFPNWPWNTSQREWFKRLLNDQL